MNLPACQERVLSRIEEALWKGEPRLASRFAIFSRLTRGEALPRTEQLTPRPWLRRVLASTGRAWRFLFPRPQSRGVAAMRPASRLRAAVVLPVLLIIMASATVVTAIAGTHPCAPAPRHPAATQTRWATCAASGTVVPGSHSTGHKPDTGYKTSHS
jgi:hypothetical protein